MFLLDSLQNRFHIRKYMKSISYTEFSYIIERLYIQKTYIVQMLSKKKDIAQFRRKIHTSIKTLKLFLSIHRL